MSEKPMFLFTGVYDDVADADADYETIKALYAADDIGSYDSAIITKRADGKVKVTKTEKPTQHGAWIGLAAGAASAVAFPFLLPGLAVTGAAGAGLGAWMGHLAHGTSREDMRELGALLDEGSAALIVVGLERDSARIEKAATRSKKRALKQLRADFDEAEREAAEAMRQAD